MESNHYLGIYLRKDAASVVCVKADDDKQSISDAFSVFLDETDKQNTPALMSLIAEKIAEKKIQYTEATAALDCSMFIQHNIHSDFTDPKEIAQTIRFDAEEILATDVSNIAIASTINSSNETGSELTIFTAEKDLLADFIASLQSNKIDPIAIEPDSHCLKRFLLEHIDISENTLLVMLSSHNAYFIPAGPSERLQLIPPRTFLIGPDTDRMQILRREIPITNALLEPDTIDCLKICDSLNSLQPDVLKENLSTQVVPIDLHELVNKEQHLDNKEDRIGLAIAFGAALSILKKADVIDFRCDFLPYQGKSKKLKKATRFLSISCTILFFILGVFLQTQWFQKNKPIKSWQTEFKSDYATIMGKEPDKRRNPLTLLKNERTRVRNEKSGQFGGMGSESLSAKLTRVLLAFNKCATQVKLNIDSINITTKMITLAGSTSNRRNTLKLRNALEENGLQIAKDSLEEKGGRDNFRITIEIK